jgi:ectoine hydroxylase-related dioxygenase (phytanoyl-CoA dioxygenase family)
LPIDYKNKRLNLVKKQDLEKNFIPITGKAGDVIFFDTNTPHKAGIIKSGYSRKVMRFDYELLLTNTKNFNFHYILKKIKSILGI